MSRRRRKGDGFTGRFVLLPHHLLDSPAWKTLPPNAAKLLLDVWKRHNGVNNGEISYAVREAAGIGLSRPIAARAFLELVDRGFMVPTREAAFRIKTRLARCWRITAEPSGGKGEVKATKEFMRWAPPAAAPDSLAGETVKSQTQSRGRDAQSHRREREPSHATKLPPTVSPARPSEDETTVPQSLQRDTFRLPGEAQPTPATTTVQDTRRSPARRMRATAQGGS